MTRLRPFRNNDSPALARLWSRGVPARQTIRPLSSHEFDALVVGKLGFEAAGLIVAERDGSPIAFVHAGFGPEQPEGPSHQLDRSLGTVGMLVAEPGLDDPGLEDDLISAAIGYLRGRGAQVLYAGGQYPLNPFYWGIYGGAEWAGILEKHASFRSAVERAGYQPVASTVLCEADLTQPELRDPKAIVFRRQTRLQIHEDPLLERWWDALALGFTHLHAFHLQDRSDGRLLARAISWQMAGFDRGDGRRHLGLIGVEVAPDHRGEGLGRYLISEILRHARSLSVQVVSAQTSSANQPALSLYTSSGFAEVETATLYRLPA